jgi:hypothetical protein
MNNQFPVHDINGVRRKTLFENYGMPDPDSVMDSTMDTFPSGNSIMDLRQSIQPGSNVLEDIGTFDTSQADAFRDLINNQPQREDPGWARRIVASGMSVGAHPGDVKDPIGVQEDVMYAPYKREMADWTAKVEPAYRSATLENTANANERQARTSVMNNNAALRRIEETERNNSERNRITEAKNEATAKAAQLRAEAYDFKVRHPDWKFNFSGPNILAVSPDGKETANLGPTGHLSDADKINLRHEKAMAEIGKRTEGQVEVAHVRGDEAQETKREVPGFNSASLSNKSTNYRTKRNDALRRAYDNPATREFIIPAATANGDYQLKPPKNPMWGGADPVKKAAYDELARSLEGITESSSEFPEVKVDVSGGVRQRAADRLKADGKPVTDANIDYLIQRGVVK